MGKVVPWEARVRLLIVGCAVGSARDKVQAVPLVELIVTLGKGQVRIHDHADGLVVVDGPGGRDAGVGFAMKVQETTALIEEGAQIGHRGLNRVHVLVHTFDHPGLKVVVSDSCHVQGTDVLPVQHLSHPLAVSVRGRDSPRVSVAIIDGSVAESCCKLEGEVHQPALRVFLLWRLASDSTGIQRKSKSPYKARH